MKYITELFEGKNQHRNYSHLLLNIVKEYEVKLKKMGVNPRDLDTHSFRKGLPTMVSDVYTVYPQIILLCIRCGCYMDGIKDIYPKCEVHGYQYVGRCASGLDHFLHTHHIYLFFLS